MFRALVIVLFLAIVVALFSSLWSLMRNPSGGHATVNRLAWRVILSVALVLLLIYGFYTGQIHSQAPW